MDSKTILKILEQSDPKDNANCLGLILLLKPVLEKAFEMHTYYDASGLVCDLKAKGNVKGHTYKLLIRPTGQGDKK
jgi:hypothetical protein